MKRKVKYLIAKGCYVFVEVDTDEQEKLIMELNTDFERSAKAEQRYHKHVVSIDELYERFGIEIADSTNEKEFIDETNQALLRDAINCLSKRQKDIIIMVYYQNKSQVKIAKELGINKSTVSITLKRAHQNIKKFLEKMNKRQTFDLEVSINNEENYFC